MLRTEIISTGMYVPPRVVTNADLTTMMDTSDEWIVQRTGIRERRWIEVPGTPTSALAEPAAKMALERAGLQPSDIDLIIFATLSPDHYFPGSGCLLQARLGAKDVPALDIRNQCSGFLYGLQVADGLIRSGIHKRILLVGAEIHSSGLDKTTRGRDVACIFGDGAAAVVLGPTSDPARGVRQTTLGADGRFALELCVPGLGTAETSLVSDEQLAALRHFPHMEGSKVFRHAVTRMPAAVRGVLEAEGVTPGDLRLLIPHQANLRISEMVQKSLGLRDGQVFNNIQKYGNTTAASIPLALHEALEEGRLQRGDWLAFTAFGAGFTWGAALLRF